MGGYRMNRQNRVAGDRPAHRRLSWKRVLVAAAGAIFVLLAGSGIYLGVSVYRIDRAVHHVAIAPSLLAQGQNDLLAVVKGPDHTEEIYAFHTTSGHTNVLRIPGKLEIAGAGGRRVAISSLNIHDPNIIVAGLSRLGIPVSRYVAVDLHAFSPRSSLGQLATGKISVDTLISDPTGTASLMEEVASHVYLGPHTPPSALLSLMKVPAGRPVSVPISTNASGRVVLAAHFAGVLRNFL